MLQPFDLSQLPQRLPYPGGTPPFLPQQGPAKSKIPPWLQTVYGGFGRMFGQQNPYLNQDEQQAARQRQMMAMAAAMMQASGPRPKNTTGPLQAVGAGIQAGQQAQDQATADALRARLLQVQMAQAQRMPAGEAAPSSVREYQFFQQLTPEQQQQYLTVKRNQPGIRLESIEMPDGTSKKVLFDPTDGAIYDLSPSGVRPPQGQPTPAQLPPGAGTTRAPEAEREAIVRAETAATSEIEAAEAERAKDQARAEMAAVAQSALDNPNLNAVFGGIQGVLPSLRQDTIDASADVDRIIALLSLESRQKMKGSGQISDYESRLLGQSATVLSNRRISDERARLELEKIASIFGGGPVRIVTDEDYAALPSGTQFYDPDGVLRTKP